MLFTKVKSKNALICSVVGYIYTQRFTKRSQNGIVAGAIMEGWKTRHERNHRDERDKSQRSNVPKNR
ncbi:hypothetical protein FH014_03925 [Listeria monocytogenes]|nr:hypothetical protein [Listeria monocytogenes]MCY61176.1 hypothetical protein [Listeria monocytogenes serotype 4c]EAG6774596.1 hypothetical protein [Listeria monocytogenes]EBF5153509.1 hypothetical protein [Listeria monocytogenes]EBF5170659.1 hypothetical protein [Listeria monocytogenes]